METLDCEDSDSFLQHATVIIPTYNAGAYMHRMREALASQGILPGQVMIVDSSSTDGTRDVAEQAGFRVYQIPKVEFSHGATRNLAAALAPDAKYLVYLTQDAIPASPGSLTRLLQAFADPEVAAAYGRQLARPKAGVLERHAREFNYPAVSAVRSLEDRERLGYRVVFFSDSFAAYRVEAFRSVGGFPDDAIVSEEVSAVGRMLLAGWKLAYVADARVVHSHYLSAHDTFSRYFDIAVHHARNPWLLEAFGGAGGEGRRFLLSEMHCALKNQPIALVGMVVSAASKFLGYSLGRREAVLPHALKRAFSAQKGYWDLERSLVKAPLPTHLDGRGPQMKHR